MKMINLYKSIFVVLFDIMESKKRLYEMTKYPDMFKGTYWGGYTDISEKEMHIYMKIEINLLKNIIL